jgi:hypothetical protein
MPSARAWKTYDAALPSRAPPRWPVGALAEIVAGILPDGCDRRVMLGPVVESGPDARRADPPVYFATVSFDDEVFTAVVGARTYAEARELRDRLRFRLLQHPIRPCLHQFDDELEMMRWAERTWPGEKTARLVHDIQAERRRN